MAQDWNPYDRVPYPVLSHAETHPDRLATVALLLGLEPVPVEGCRVLEVGCASGGNLLPMAASLPGSTFLGLDYSAVQVGAARELAEELDLANIRFEYADVRTFDPGEEQFDYIIAHGVYSWVPPEAQDALLALCGRALSECGVAYVSYNTLPGWSLMLTLRDILLFGAGSADEPAARLERARGAVELLNAHAPPDSYVAAVLEGWAALQESTASIAGADGGALTLHDHLAEYNQPCYLHQFVAHAARHGLQYLGDADFPSHFPRGISREAAEAFSARSASRAEYDQYMDWLTNRGFRRTLLCRDASQVQLRIDARQELMQRLRARSRSRPEKDATLGESPTAFVSPRGGRLTTNHPLSKAALLELELAYPRSVPVAELGERAAQRLAARGRPATMTPEDAAMIGATLLQGFSYDPDLVELRTWEPPVTIAVSERPRGLAYARAAVYRGVFSVPNAYHQRVNLAPPQAAVLGLLDGTRDRAAVEAGLAEMLEPGEGGEGPPPALEDLVEETLRFLAHACLLIA